MYKRQYFSDGTVNGTSFVRNFGIYLHKDGNFPAITGHIVVDGALYFSYSTEVDVSSCCGQSAANPNLWRIESGDPNMVNFSDTDQFSDVGKFFNHPGFDNRTIFFFRNGGKELWKTKSDDSIEIVTSFEFDEPPTFFHIHGPGSAINNSKGAYFCTINFELNVSKLWRISNSGALDFITRDCDPSSLVVFEDRLYFEQSTGLSSTSGVLGDINQLYSINNAEYALRSGTHCEIEGHLYVPITTQSELIILKVDKSENVNIFLQRSMDEGVTFLEQSNCFSEEQKIIYRVEKQPPYIIDNSHWLVDVNTQEQQLVKVDRSSEKLTDFEFTTSLLRRSVSDRAIEFCSTFFCIADTTKLYYPMIMDLLLSPKNEYESELDSQ